jgi:hypothetical protein
MPLLNYTTSIDAERTAGDIIGLLARHGARMLQIEYDHLANPAGLSFMIPTAEGELFFKLPVDADAVLRVLIQQSSKGEVPRSVAVPLQARKVAWRINLDWVKVQLALIESEMATLEQIFLPYMLVNGRTVYQLMQAQAFKALPERVPNG